MIASQQTVPPPPPTSLLGNGVIINATPNIVPKGQTSVVNWNVSGATSCSVTGNGNTWTGVTGSHTTNAITKRVTYTLTCPGLGGTLTGSVVVTIPAKFQEY